MPSEDRTAGTLGVPLVRVNAGARYPDRDVVAVEEPMEVRVNGASFAVIMRTPGADAELAAGFLLAEDVVRSADELAAVAVCDDEGEAGGEEGRGNTVNATVTGEAVERLGARLAERRQVTMTAACGLCGRRTIESLRTRAAAVAGRWQVPAAVIAALPDRLRTAQRAFRDTGGLHAAGLFDRGGRLIDVAEDVGRHNAVDKIVGRALIEGRLPLDEGILLVSGRTSYELVQKALLAGIPLIAAISAPSSLAVALAAEAGITLCGFVRGESCNVYAHPQRVTASLKHFADY